MLIFRQKYFQFCTPAWKLDNPYYHKTQINFFTNLASCVPWRNDFEIRGVLSLGSRIDSRNLSTIVLDKIQRGLWIFNKFESFRFAKGRHVIVFTILITRKSVKMDGVNVIDTIRQFLRNFLWFLLLCIELTTCFHEFYENESIDFFTKKQIFPQF